MASTRSDLLPPQDHGGNLDDVRLRYGLEFVSDFSISVHPSGPPEGLWEHLTARRDEITRYPDRACEALRSAAVRRFGFGPECFLAGNGSAELIDLVARAGSWRRLVLSPPDFGLYEALAPAALPVIRVPRDPARGFSLPLERLGAMVQEGDLVVFSNPGNPSGATGPAQGLEELLDRCAAVGAVLALDEAFADFCPEESLLRLAGKNPSLLVVRSMTKFYAIPGLRLGYLVGSPAHVARVRSLQVPWSVSTLAQSAGVYCLEQTAWDAQARRFIRVERERVSRALGAVPGIEPLPSKANYLLVRIEPPAPAPTEIYQQLARRGIVVRHCGSFGLGERYLRVGLRTPKENDHLVAALAEVVGSMRQAGAD